MTDTPTATAVATLQHLRAELDKLREAHEQRGLYPAALAYVGAISLVDGAPRTRHGERPDGAYHAPAAADETGDSDG